MVRSMRTPSSKRLVRAFLAVVLIISTLGLAGMAFGNDKNDIHPLTDTAVEEVANTEALSEDGTHDPASSDRGETDGVTEDATSGNPDADRDGSDSEGTDPLDGDGSDEGEDPEDEDESEVIELPSGIFIDDVRFDVTDQGLLKSPDAPEGSEADEAYQDALEAYRKAQAIFGAFVSNDAADTIVISDGGSHSMQIKDITYKGYIKVEAGTTLKLDGDGTIDLTGKGASAGSAIIVTGKDAKLYLNTNQAQYPGDITIKGGTGTLVNAHLDFENDSNYTGGGAILVQRSAKSTYSECQAYLEMGGGIITGNSANAGGGIFIDRWCGFVMNGGTVSGNTAKKYEGGGIYIAGMFGATDPTAGSCAYIGGGDITDNTTETTFSWGGGGVFIESKGVLKLASSLITENAAKGLGGGISGCPHAYIGVGKITGGAAIFGNDAAYHAHPTNKALQCLQTDNADKTDIVYSGDMYAYGYDYDSNGYYDTSAQKGAWSKRYFEANAGNIGKDYYCTKSSIIEGSDMGQTSGNAWVGYVAGSMSKAGYNNGANSFGKEISIAKGNSYTAVDETLALTNTLPKGTQNAYTVGRSVTITGNTSHTHGGGIGCNGTLVIGDLEEGEETEPISVDLEKKLVNNLDEKLAVAQDQFDFDVFASTSDWAKGDKLGTFSTADNGRVTLQIPSTDNSKPEKAYFLIEEVAGDRFDIEYDSTTYGVEVTLDWQDSEFMLDGVAVITKHTPTVTAKNFVKIDADGNAADIGSSLTVTNRLNLQTDVELGGNKYYYGMLTGDDAQFGFTMAAISDPFANNVDASTTINSLIRHTEGAIENESDYIYDDGDVQLTLTATNGDYANNKAQFAFAKVNYEKPGSYYYVISEDTKQDPKVYVAEVLVSKVDGADKAATALKAEIAGLYAARSINDLAADLSKYALDAAKDTIDFHNMDTVEGISLNGYLVSAASNTAIEQRCLVDPKVYKKLLDVNGKEVALRPNQFWFQLFKVNDTYSEIIDTKAVSSTSNDAFGMVDFDAAANVSTDPDNPCCLEFNTAGTYCYRVYEDPDHARDPSVIYDETPITFTAVIEHVNGALVCTDMYYGYLDEDGKNVRFEESKDPSWHPTITNRAKGMDLRVQKTSVADRQQGLENAVYGLWMYNPDKEGDLYLGNAKSGEDGYMVFENVNLSYDNYYYFLEEEAPDFHTVSRYRSMYFKLADSEDGGVTLVYYDSIGGKPVDAAGEPVSVGKPVEPAADFADVEGAVALFSLEDDAAVDNPTMSRVSLFAARDGASSNNMLTYLYDWGVYDELTRVNVSKLETHTHEFVAGAELAIIERDTGRTVSSWTTGGETSDVSGRLNVGTQYILREVHTPEGYATAKDVIFTLDDYGNISVISGTEGGNAEVIGDSITLYDTLLDGENVTYRTRTIGGDLPQTGDMLMNGLLILLGLMAVGGLIGGAALLRRNRAAASAHPKMRR